MSFDLYVYDNTMTALSSGYIEFLEENHAAKSIHVQANGPFNGAYGATLKTPAPLVNVTIWVTDRAKIWSPTSLGFFNANYSPRLDVALYPVPLPSAGGGGGGGGGSGGRFNFPSGGPTSGGPTAGGPTGGGPRTPATTPLEIDALIGWRITTGEWKQEEATGVRELVRTATHALISKRSATLDAWLNDWLELLENYGIRLRDAHHGGSGPGGSPGFIPIDVFTKQQTLIVDG
jgi:hypothetical protein